MPRAGFAPFGASPFLLKACLRVRSQYVYGQTDEKVFLVLVCCLMHPSAFFLVAPMASNHGLCGRGSSNEKNDFPDKVLTSRDLL